jgi:hypothetical protein
MVQDIPEWWFEERKPDIMIHINVAPTPLLVLIKSASLRKYKIFQWHTILGAIKLQDQSWSSE